MNLFRAAEFIADLERQYEWYVENVGFEVADRYLDSVQSACDLLSQHPMLGPACGFSHPRLAGWRFLLATRPFQKHILSYEITNDQVQLRRIMHGHRDLPRRLIQKSGVE